MCSDSGRVSVWVVKDGGLEILGKFCTGGSYECELELVTTATALWLRAHANSSACWGSTVTDTDGVLTKISGVTNRDL